MYISITGRHIEITSALRDYVEKKVSKLSRYFNNIIDAHVILGLEGKTDQVAEITIHANGITIQGEECSEDMYASIDKVLEKVERQIKKYKEKISKHTPRFSSKIKRNIILNIMRQEHEVKTEPIYKVVKTKKFEIKPMSIDEAIMQMDLLGDNFLVFVNADTDRTNIIYHRKDGTYGLIDKDY